MVEFFFLFCRILTEISFFMFWKNQSWLNTVLIPYKRHWLESFKWLCSGFNEWHFWHFMIIWVYLRSWSTQMWPHRSQELILDHPWLELQYLPTIRPVFPQKEHLYLVFIPQFYKIFFWKINFEALDDMDFEPGSPSSSADGQSPSMYRRWNWTSLWFQNWTDLLKIDQPKCNKGINSVNKMPSDIS